MLVVMNGRLAVTRMQISIEWFRLFYFTNMKKYRISLRVILYYTLMSVCLLSCGSNDEKDDIVPENPIEICKKKLVGTWKLETYISYEREGHKYIPFGELTEEQIDYYGLSGSREVTFKDDNTLHYYQDDGRKIIRYKIEVWNKDAAGEHFDYRIYVSRDLYLDFYSWVKFPDANTLHWMTQTSGYIYKRK